MNALLDVSPPVPAWEIPPEALPNVDNLITEDDTPVDNLFSEKQQRLLVDSLYNSWQADKPYVAMSNVGLFYAIKKPPLVPDTLVSLGVSPPEEAWQKQHRSYFVWEYGKPPDAVIEIVSNREGGEDTTKLKEYAEIGIDYYVIFDPEQHLSERLLRVYKRTDIGYVETLERWLPKIGLGLATWEGTYQDLHSTWLRWRDADKQILATGGERAEKAEQRAEQESQRAEQAEQRAAALAARLKELGLEE